ncbi:MAG TPA: Calx-beta domain-containing protein [Solirubrobacterales bacterium]|nr:Calx-beta domain-containing protein [Solirubrobacterales bacterium]
MAILDREPLQISIDNVAVTEGDAGQTATSFTVTLNNASSQQVTVGFATSNGSAAAPGDYASSSGTATFAANDTTETVTVQVNGDTMDEPNETFNVDLSNATIFAAIADAQGVGTINDDDPVPSISIDDVAVTEGDAGQTPAAFTVSLTNASSQQVTVDFATSDASASAPGDYASNSGTATFTSGDTSEPVTVQVNGDTIDEADETFNLGLSNPTIATIADNQGVGTITDDDVTIPLPPAPGPGLGDATPPETTITKGPKDKTKKRTATFEFSANEAATFECSLDGKSVFKPCTSPFTVKVKKGKHTFQVQARDTAGNLDATPATDSWKVKKKRK